MKFIQTRSPCLYTTNRQRHACTCYCHSQPCALLLGMVSSNTYVFLYMQSVMQAFVLKRNVTSSQRSVVFRPTPYCSQAKLPC